MISAEYPCRFIRISEVRLFLFMTAYRAVPVSAGRHSNTLNSFYPIHIKVLQPARVNQGVPDVYTPPNAVRATGPLIRHARVFFLNAFCPMQSAVYIVSLAGFFIVDTKQNDGIPAKKKPAGNKAKRKEDYFTVLDIETQRSAQEVGGWHRADLMRVSCAVLYDSRADTYLEFLENQIPDLIAHMSTCDAVIGFNIKRFDYKVLTGYSDFDFHSIHTIDILEKVHERLGYRLSLDHLATETLG